MTRIADDIAAYDRYCESGNPQLEHEQEEREMDNAQEWSEDIKRQWYERGRYDAKHERGVLMRPTASGDVVYSCDPPDEWDLDFALKAARAYYNGYQDVPNE